MRIKQNLTLVVLIILLLSIIFSINTLNIISLSEVPGYLEKDIRVDVGKVDFAQNYKNINVNIILDTSMSMWEKVDGKNKIKTAKDITEKIINDLPNNIYLGLRFTNEEAKVKIKQNNKDELINKIKGITKGNYLNIGQNLELAQIDLKELEGKKHIILITDGQDYGDVMPTKIASQLNNSDINLHIIQVGEINRLNYIQLKNLSEVGRGNYYTYFEEDRVIHTINLESKK